VAYAFDPDQPAARRLLETAREMTRLERVEILAPVLLPPEEPRRLQPGDEVALPAILARGLIDQGHARAAG
jgi:hypothetical protein